jgi:hypothetical protein
MMIVSALITKTNQMLAIDRLSAEMTADTHIAMSMVVEVALA